MSNKSVEDALRVLTSQGYLVGDIRRQMNEREMHKFYLDKPLNDYEAVPLELTEDEYFTSFDENGNAPAWNPKLLAVGRCFTLSRGQLEALKGLCHLQVFKEVTIADLEILNGYIYGATFRFPSHSKVTKLRLGKRDFIKWVRKSKSLDSAYSEEAAERDAIKAKKSAAKKKEQDAAWQTLVEAGLV